MECQLLLIVTIFLSPYRFVMFEGASPSGNIASKCGGGNCKYNFADDTYTDLGNGQIYKAGE